MNANKTTSPFKVGEIPKGNDFIGRKRVLAHLRQELLRNSFTIAISVVGLPKIGKTSTVLKSLEDAPENTLIIYLDLKNYSNPHQFWHAIIDKIKSFLEKNKKLDSRFDKLLVKAQDLKTPWLEFLISMTAIFDEMSKVGIKTILIFDSFDYAAKIFEDNDRHFELFRSLTLGQDLNISMVAISEAPVWMIEENALTEGSFYPIFDYIHLRGFEATDLFEYYNRLEENGIKVTEELKEKIHYYAGKNPYLLFRIAELIQQNPSEDLNEFIEKDEVIKGYYDHLTQRLKRKDRIKLVKKSLTGDGDALTQDNWDRLYLLGYIKDVNGKTASVSPYFEEKIKENEW